MILKSRMFMKAFFASSFIVFVSGCAGSGGLKGGGVSSAEIPVKTVENQDVFYHGWLPCHNCDAIELEVYLKPETSSFDLVASYINHPDGAPDERYSGDWSASQGIRGDSRAVVYKLSPHSASGQDYFFMKVGEDELELIAPNLSRYNNHEMMRINKSSPRREDSDGV